MPLWDLAEIRLSHAPTGVVIISFALRTYWKVCSSDSRGWFKQPLPEHAPDIIFTQQHSQVFDGRQGDVPPRAGSSRPAVMSDQEVAPAFAEEVIAFAIIARKRTVLWSERLAVGLVRCIRSHASSLLKHVYSAENHAAIVTRRV